VTEIVLDKEPEKSPSDNQGGPRERELEKEIPASAIPGGMTPSPRHFGKRSRDDNDILAQKRPSLSVTMQEGSPKGSMNTGSIHLWRTSGEFKDFKVRRNSYGKFFSECWNFFPENIFWIAVFVW
jgi:hypothetical protein